MSEHKFKGIFRISGIFVELYSFKWRNIILRQTVGFIIGYRVKKILKIKMQLDVDVSPPAIV